MQIQELLMSDEEFRKKEYSHPYNYKIYTKAKTELFYFGANHSADPNNYQYPILKKEWEEFIKDKPKDKCIVFVEGGQRYIPAESLEQAVLEGSEGSFIFYLAFNDGVHVECPEPSRKIINNKLEQKYDRDSIQYYFFARVVHQWNRFLEKPEFNSYMKLFLESDKEESKWLNYDFSLENMINIHKKLFNKEFNKEDSDFFYSIINPHMDTSIINKISKEEDFVRDEYIVKAIVINISRGINVFNVFGSGHAVVQQPALISLIESI